jgi:Protein of unknown function (DUF3137)
MVLFVLFFIFVVVVGFVSYFVGQQRIRDMAAFATAHGLTVIGNDWDLGDCGFPLFHAGNRRYWHNVLRGAWSGLPVTYCDYSYVVSDGKNQNTISFSNVIATLGVQMPQVTVSPRSAIGAFAEKSIGAPGIHFESIDFNDRFDVKSSDDAFAVELIDAQMIETLLGLDHSYHVVFGPLYLMVYAHRKPVAEIGSILDATALITQRIPALVRVPEAAPDLPSGV